jgi:predicted secreted protein
MRKILLFAIASLVLLATAVSCKSVESVKSDNPTSSTTEISMRNYDEINNNPHIQKQIEVINGGEFSVTLLSNASTGFSWNENAVITDTSIVQQIKHEAIGSGSNVPGAAGAEKWNFKVLKQGATTVHLEYGRPWAGGENGVWTFDLAVTVK